MSTRAVLRAGLIIGILIFMLAPHARVSTLAQSGGSIQLAVDTANVNQDGLLVLFGGLRMQGEVGLPVSAGDVNGDGRDDVIFCGMYGSSNSRVNNGVVNFYISDGRDSGFVNTADNPPNVFKLHGQSSGDLLGTSVSASGDVNGDGIRDVAIGACNWDRTGSVTNNAGAAYVVLGSRGFNLDADLATADGTPPAGIIAIRGPQSGGRMGIWIDEGDVDGDGIADIIIGSDQINSAAGQHVGGAYIVFGSPALPPVIDLAAPPAGVRTARIIGQRREEHWGAALQVGDINNDGIGDVIIGGSIFRDSASYVSPGDDVTGHDARGAGFNGQRPFCGEVYVVYGQHNWPETIDLTAPPPNATHVIGAHAVDLLGSQVHSGDINGDGKTDLILGALQAEAPDNKGKTGAVYVVYGSAGIVGATIDLANPDASGLRVTTIYGEQHLDCAGDSVRAFDINRDGMSDLFIGSPERTFEMPNGELREDAGVTEVIYGQRDFLPAVIKLYDPPASPPVFRLAGGHDDDEFSYRLWGGDVDGDGYVDYIANAMHGDGLNGGILNAGNVYVFSGKKLSARLNMLPVDTTPAPQIASATLSVNGQTVQQANAGQSGIRITITGANLRQDTEVTINGNVVVSHLEGSPARIRIELDENPAIRNSAGQIVVRARNTAPPPSIFSNEAVAGRLVGPEITSVKVKKKSSGMLILKINGSNFPLDGRVEVRAGGQLVNLKNDNVDESGFIDTKIKANAAPPSGTTLHVIVRAQSGIQSNEATAVVP
ncbi:MAG TPA: IPT/TIG domain-containing protein [Blastocatellia bacterium]|nr:IPT/TIG domain-containing protein [Blastocatellia bacterium]